MPHQCLKCGKIFEDKSPELLKGCTVCNGNHFFYTKEPLDEDEREKLSEKLDKDINLVVTDLIDTKVKNILDESGDWIDIKPKDIRETRKIVPDSKENIDVITDTKYAEKIIEKVKVESAKSNRPETIAIEEPGKYRIDLKGLLEEEPIIIQRDGTYTIHLPSVFKMIDKEKKKSYK